MSNPFYNYSGNFIPGTLARAETSQQEFQAVQAGFSLLVTEGVDSGVASAYVVTTSGQPTGAYADGSTVEFKPLFAPTGSATINVNGVGVVPLLRFNGAATQVGDFSANQWVTATYNSIYSGFTIASPSAVVVYPGTISGAAPTHKVGLVAAGGVSTAAAPIDVTFAIDQSIAPTWTGAHTFSADVVISASSGTALTITGAGGVGSKVFQFNAGGSSVYGLMDTTNVAGAYIGLSISGTLDGIIGMGAVAITGAALADLCLTPNTGVLRLGYNNGAATALSIGNAGNVTINAPSSGDALVVKGGTNTIDMWAPAANTGTVLRGYDNLGSTAVGYLDFVNGTGGVGGATEVVLAGLASTANDYVTIVAGSARRLQISGTGNVTINAPSSGTTLALTSVSGQYGIVITGTTSSGSIQFIDGGAGNQKFAIGSGLGTVGTLGFYDVTNSATRMSIAGTGGVTINAPSSGNPLTVTQNSGSSALVINGAAATAFNAIQMTQGAQTSWYLYQKAGDTAFRIYGGQDTIVCTPAGNVSIPAPSSGASLTVTGLATGSNAGLIVNAGDAYYCAEFNNTSSSVNFLLIKGDGSVIVGNSPAGGGEGAGTLNVQNGIYLNGVNQFQTGTFTGTITGCTTSPTATIRYVIVGNMCTLFFPNLTGTSNSTSATITGLPAVCQPTTNAQAQPIATMEDNGNPGLGGYVQVQVSSGTMILALAESTAISNRVEYVQTGFTNSGTKGLGGGSITYSLI